MVDKYGGGIGYGRKLAAGISVVALGCALTLSMGDLVQSQPTSPLHEQPAAGPAPAPAAALREDQVELLLKTLGDAESHGFDANTFSQNEIAGLVHSRDPAARQRGGQLLMRSIVAYAQAQHGGRVPAARFPDDWSIVPVAYDAAADFNFALAQDKLADWTAALPPPFERYRALRTALGQYRAIEARGGWKPIDEGQPLKPGMKGPRVVQLRERLAAENPPGAIETTSKVYDPQLAEVVMAAQARYGLNPDGVVARGTLKAFNTPVEARIAQIAANMERWRWMPRAWPVTRVEVNIAAASLDAYDQNRSVATMKVVVGAPDKKTPMLQSAIHSVVLNPPWNVPKSIASKELIPKGQSYLASKGYTWVSNGAGGSRLQQRPGPDNSLGRIKFDFDNPFGVYLHDTNAKTAFGRDARSVSHGCVRVERPDELANLLLGSDPNWSEGRLEEVLAENHTVRERLAQKIPVFLLYWTVFTDDTGQVNFRNDIYGWDDQLLQMLKGGGIAA